MTQANRGGSGEDRRQPTDLVVDNKLLSATARLSTAALAVLLPWLLYQVIGAVQELEQAIGHLRILVARMEERDSGRAEQISELRRRLESVERR